mgnify:CR=1 FL=1
MNSLSRTKALLVAAVVAAACAAAFGQEFDEEEEVVLKQKKLSGPRMGVTYILPGKFAERIEEKGMDPVLSQFGWHFEFLVRPEGGGPAFVTELIPFLGGVEYNTVIPSLSLVLGIRMPMGFEFGMGPNVLATFEKGSPVSTTLLIAVGQSLKFSGVQIPLNLAFSTNRDGQRLSFVFGYAIHRRS